jgi:aspartate 1-decarboxylase
MLRSKIHRARVTEILLDYEGSLKLDRAVMEAANIVPFEMVKVYNISNGERFDTYVVPEKRDSGTVGLMGAAARKGAVGDLIIIATYVLVDEAQIEGYVPTIVHVDGRNRVSSISTA